MVGEEEINKNKHITDYFAFVSSEEKRDRSALDNMGFDVIGEQEACWLERKFKEEDIRDAILTLVGDKEPGPNGFPMEHFGMFLRRMF